MFSSAAAFVTLACCMRVCKRICRVLRAFARVPREARAKLATLRAGMYTVLVYLSRAEGGQTEFRGVDDEGREVTARVVPEPGLALVFYHHQWHAGARVTGGTKYVARSEVVCVKH